MGQRVMNTTIRAATIIQIIPHLETGGAEMATVEICDALARAGGRCFVLSEGGRMERDVTAAGGLFVPFPAATKNPARIVANGLALARFMRERGVDLIHARSRAPAWSALIAARRTGLGFVTTYHGAYGDRGPGKNLYNSVMARGDRVIANSRFTAQLIQERHGTPSQRLRVIPRGVDIAAFDPRRIAASRIRALRARWGVPGDHRILLHAARLTDWKGQKHVIEAAARLQEKGLLEKVSVILAGDAQGREGYRQELEGMISGHALAKVVHIVGHCSDMPAAFAAAHAAVVASVEAEAFGRASAEAQAAGCPVIVTQQGASPETVLLAERDGAGQETGWLVPVADPDALAQAFARALALSDPERKAIGARARAHAESQFSAQRMKRDTLAVYDEILRSALARAFDDSQPA
ncbi:MAG: glycosyltransferase family 4 protein [Methyloligellaceae bacterium]